MRSTFWFATALSFASLFGACSSSEGTGVDAGTTGGTCGNGTCDPGETTSSCSADCPAPVCGDNTCASSESPATCAADCGPPCGNNVCDVGETTSSCPGDCPTVCGNNVCEVGETISSCAADCMSAACTVGDPNSCTGETICIANKCENAFGRNYRIKIVSAAFTATKANGDAWDAFNGLPDGKATLTLNGVAFTTPSVNDTLTPTWNYVTTPVLIPGGTSMMISVVDADLTLDDAGWSCTNNPLTANLIRAGARCSGTGALANAHVDFTFTPQ